MKQAGTGIKARSAIIAGLFGFATVAQAASNVWTVIDNSDGGPDFTETGTWFNTGGSDTNDWSGDSRFTSTAGAVATWSFTGLSNGTYEVAASWSVQNNRSQVAPFTVQGITHLVNQEVLADDFTLNDGSDDIPFETISTNAAVTAGTLTVTLTQIPNGGGSDYCIADAVAIKSVAPETVTYAVSTNWSSQTVPADADVIINPGATVTVDVEAAAGSLQIDGTLLLPLDTTGFGPMNLSREITVGGSGSIEVDGSVYEGFDGYFPLILSTNLPGSLTNNVTFSGFLIREPAGVVQSDGLWLRLIAPPSLSARLCSMVPDSTVAADWSNTTFSATRALQPTVSAWAPTFNEAHVQDTTLSQTVGGNATLSWEMRLARGGNLYSLRTPVLGETVPPSYRAVENDSPWNDEVWQVIAVGEKNDPPDNKYFLHQSGVYLRDPVLTEPFYSPQVAAHLDEAERSFTTINWTPQAHVDIYTDATPTNDWKSYMLSFTRYRDLGQGVIEVSLGCYNYGTDLLNWFDMPWGGVRRTSTEYAFVSNPGGTNWFGPITNNWGNTLDFNDTGGWIGYSDTTNGVTPALGLVVGEDATPVLPDQTMESWFSWGYAGGTDTGNEADWRNYIVTAATRHYDLLQGSGVWSRHYFVLGDDMQDLSARIADRNLVDVQLAVFDYTEASTPLIGYSFSGAGTAFRIEENSNAPDFFLYAHPLAFSYPLFEVIRADESRYLTWDPYVNGIVKPYDGTIAGLRLLGFAMPLGKVNFGQSVYNYSFLSSVLSGATGNYKAGGEILMVRTIATDIERWRVEHFGLADDDGDGANTANPDNDSANNLWEYGLGGNPINGGDIGTEPVFELGANWLDYVHVRRVAGTNEISYTLEITTNLVSGTWSNTGYSVEGYGPLVGDFDTVTNRIDTSVEDQQFIKLIIE